MRRTVAIGLLIAAAGIAIAIIGFLRWDTRRLQRKAISDLYPTEAPKDLRPWSEILKDGFAKSQQTTVVALRAPKPDECKSRKDGGGKEESKCRTVAGGVDKIVERRDLDDWQRDRIQQALMEQFIDCDVPFKEMYACHDPVYEIYYSKGTERFLALSLCWQCNSIRISSRGRCYFHAEKTRATRLREKLDSLFRSFMNPGGKDEPDEPWR